MRGDERLFLAFGALPKIAYQLLKTAVTCCVKTVYSNRLSALPAFKIRLLLFLLTEDL
jgi:hypothetical protein